MELFFFVHVVMGEAACGFFRKGRLPPASASEWCMQPQLPVGIVKLNTDASLLSKTENSWACGVAWDHKGLVFVSVSEKNDRLQISGRDRILGLKLLTKFCMNISTSGTGFKTSSLMCTLKTFIVGPGTRLVSFQRVLLMLLGSGAERSHRPPSSRGQTRPRCGAVSSPGLHCGTDAGPRTA